MSTSLILHIFLLGLCLSILPTYGQQSDSDYSQPSDLFDDRLLAQSERKSIRIEPIFYLGLTTGAVKTKIQNQIVPAAISYFQAALKVEREPTKLKFSSTLLYTECSLYPAPQSLTINGISADLVLIITTMTEYGSTAADSFSCIFSQRTNRPLVGVIRYNIYDNNDWSGMDEMSYEADLYTTMHEITHVLGFSINQFETFIDPMTRKVLKNITSEREINGVLATVLSVEPLTTRLRKYFDCPTLEGAYLENQGGAGSKDSHFERRIFYNEFMTASRIEDRRISEFTLALLEGSGWYTPDYSMAEPLQWGKGKGCAFLNEKCIDTSEKARFEEFFCDKRETIGCSYSGQSIGYCGDSSMSTGWGLDSEFDYFGDSYAVRDKFADNCPYYSSTAGKSCQDADNGVNKKSGVESYGPGSMCFTGNIRKDDKNSYYLSSDSFYCIKQSCKELLPGFFSLALEIEGNTYYCSDDGFVRVEGYAGRLNCPSSIDEYCSTKIPRHCKRGCMGRGVCKNGECICNEGFGGLGCSLITGPIPKVEDVDVDVDESEQSSDEEEESDSNYYVPTKRPTEDYPSSSYTETSNNNNKTNNLQLLICSAFIASMFICFGKFCFSKQSEPQQQPPQSNYHPASNISRPITMYSQNPVSVQTSSFENQLQQNSQQTIDTATLNINSNSIRNNEEIGSS